MRRSASRFDRASLTITAGLVPAVVRYFCIGESVAVPFFHMLRERTTVPVARRALDRVMRDAPRHRQFGWTSSTGSCCPRETRPWAG